MAPKRPATIRAGLADATARPLGQLVAAFPGIAGSDPFDPIHDARVSLRRLAALLRAFAPYLPAARVAYLKREIRWLRRELGPARDLDVFIHETVPELSDLFTHEAGLEALLETAAAKRARLGTALGKIVASPRAKRLLASLQETLGANGPTRRRAQRRNGSSLPPTFDSPFDAFVLAVLSQRWKKIRKIRRLTKLTKALLHKLRIRLRNFRYLCDGFVAMLPERRYTMLRRAMTSLQDHIGALNDAAIAPNVAAALAKLAARTHDAAAVSRAAGLFAGWGAARRQVFHATLDEPWHGLVKRGDRMLAAMKD
jgi:CHAD domain-containing protein